MRTICQIHTVVKTGDPILDQIYNPTPKPQGK